MNAQIDPAALRRVSPVAGRPRFAALRTIWALMLREMSITYGKSWGGYFWTVAESIAGIVLLTSIFSLMMRAPPIGRDFAIFYATGLVPYMFYHTITQRVATAIVFSRPLLGYPAVTFLDAVLARIIVNTMTLLLIGYIMFTTILALNDTRTNPQLFQIALAYAMALAFATGLGLVNCVLFARFPEWESIWGVLNRPMMILSGVLFIHDNVPHPYDDYMWWNPLVHVIGQMRKGFYLSYPGDYVSPTYVFLLSLILGVIGMALLLRYYREILHEW